MAAHLFVSITYAQEDGAPSTEPAEISIGIGTPEFNRLTTTEQYDAIIREFRSKISRIGEIDSGFLAEGRYIVPEGETNLETLTTFFEEVRADLQIGGSLRNVLQTSISNTRDIAREIGNNPNLPSEKRDDLLEKLDEQLVRFETLRNQVDRVRDRITYFVEVEAPAKEEEFRFERLIDRNAELIAEFSDLTQLLNDVLDHVGSPESDLPVNTD